MIPEKSLVVYKNRPAVVTSTGEKITITVPGGESIRVREKDVELLHQGPASLLDLDEKHSSTVKDTWELLEDSVFSLQELAELAFDEWTPATAWSAYILLKDGLYFSGTINEIQAQKPAAVAAEEQRRSHKQTENEEHAGFLARLIAGTVQFPEDERFLQDVVALAYGKTEHSRTLKDICRHETPQEAYKLLLHIGFWDKWVNPYPARFGLSGTSANVSVAPPPDEERVDLTYLKAFAIDNAWSDDPDDAVSIEAEKKVVWVHVADPAASVLPSTPADKEACGRGVTLYLPEGVARMLAPEALSLFALGLSAKSLALSFKISLRDDGSIADVEIIRSVIAVTRMTYAEADISLDTDVAALFAFAERNEKRRRADGAIIFDFPDVHIAVDGTTVSIVPVPAYRSSDLVRECMLLAGEAAALWACRRQVPFPFVSQDIGDLPASSLPGYAGSYQLRRCMRPRVLSTKPAPHAGLGLPRYAQVTSPLRRYTDLLAHQQIRAVLRGQEPDKDIAIRLATADVATVAAIQTDRASCAHWTAVYLSDKKDSAWEAIIIDTKHNGFTILVPALGIETTLITRKDYALNEAVTVILKSVRIPEADWMFTD
jgi:exoribonuclease-2